MTKAEAVATVRSRRGGSRTPGEPRLPEDAGVLDLLAWMRWNDREFAVNVDASGTTEDGGRLTAAEIWDGFLEMVE